jgi:hypothetical protein
MSMEDGTTATQWPIKQFTAYKQDICRRFILNFFKVKGKIFHLSIIRIIYFFFDFSILLGNRELYNTTILTVNTNH